MYWFIMDWYLKSVAIFQSSNQTFTAVQVKTFKFVSNENFVPDGHRLVDKIASVV